MSTSTHNTIDLGSDTKFFYREAGKSNKKNVLLLHGYPTSSFQFRTLINKLAPKYHVVAPDLPGFGFTEVPKSYVYTFANLADSVDQFVKTLKLKSFAIYIFDYGSPVGLRLALKDPSRITGIISQNGNAYVEGLDDRFWKPLKTFWSNGDRNEPQLNQALTQFVKDKANVDQQYYHGESDTSSVDPIAPFSDFKGITRSEESVKTQIDLFFDYRTNVEKYPEFQEFFRQSNVPILVVWGKNDYIFSKEGAEAFKRDSKNVTIKYIDGGHFALETHPEAVGEAVESFLDKIL